jgi:hypothetical protein
MQNETFLLSAAPPTCRPPEHDLQALVSPLIWEATLAATGLNASKPVTIGTTIDFICPSSVTKNKLSKDDDGFHDNDDKYTILCSTNRWWKVS